MNLRMLCKKLFLPMFVFVVAGSSSSNENAKLQKASKPQDACVEEAIRLWYDELAGKFKKYINFTESMYPSRRLYGVLFSGGFTKDDFLGFCSTHSNAKSKIDKCPSSIYRQMVLDGFGLADYICVKRVKDFAEAMSCMQVNYHYANSTCAPECSQYENRSIGYTHALANHIITNILPYYMAGDCSYLKCMANCRRPLLAEKCGRSLGALDTDALYACFSTSRNIYEPVELRLLLNRGLRSFYPYECRSIAESAACDTGYDSTTATTALTQGPALETRILIALWTSDTVVATLPAECNLEGRARKVLCHFNVTKSNAKNETCF